MKQYEISIEDIKQVCDFLTDGQLSKSEWILKNNIPFELRRKLKSAFKIRESTYGQRMILTLVLLGLSHSTATLRHGMEEEYVATDVFLQFGSYLDHNLPGLSHSCQEETAVTPMTLPGV